MRRTPEHLAASVERMAARCRELGLAVTPQRLTIYRALLDSTDHPSPEALYDRVRPQLPSLSLATIYKTLDTLVAIGVTAELPSTGDTKRYDANMERHQHLVCRVCRSVEDFDDRTLAAVKLPRRAAGFTPESISIHVQGVCRRCQAKVQPRTPTLSRRRDAWQT